MRILHIDTGSEMRGGQHQVMLLLKLLAAEGHELTLLARERSPLFESAQSAGFRVCPANLRNVLVRSIQSDLTHVHDARAHSLAAIASRRPFVVSRRVAFPLQRNAISSWKYRKAARFLAVSRFVARQLQAARVDPDKIDVVYDAVPEGPEGVWDPARPAVAIDSKDPGKGRELVQEAAKIAGIPIHFSTDLAHDLLRASVFVYVSRSEGLGSAALLAMQKGIPVVASRVEGLAEVFEHEVSGLYTGNSPAEVAESMRRILSDHQAAQKMIVAAKERVRQNFSEANLVERTVAAYKKVLRV